MSGVHSRGVLFVHSTPRALCPHIEWAASSVLGVSIELDWADQPAERGMLRGEYAWTGSQGAGARMASALRGWSHLRYEVTEDPSSGMDGGRWSHTPSLGIFYAATDSHGNIVVPEDRIRVALDAGDARKIRDALHLALGQAWDDELEPFRYAGAGAPVRWLHRVG